MFNIYIMNNPILILASLFLTLMFFLSGFKKITAFSSTAKGLVTKTNVPFTLAKILIVGVILLEIIAPGIIVFYAYSLSPALLVYAKLSIIGLILFTILATVLYHFPPTGANYYSFLSNLSTLGGLMLLYKSI